MIRGRSAAVLWVAAVLLLVVGVAWWFVQKHVAAAAEAEVDNALNTVASATRQALESWAFQNTRAAEHVASWPEVIAFSGALLEGPRNRGALRQARVQSELRQKLKPVDDVQGFSGFMLIDANGIVLASDQDTLVGARSILRRQHRFLERVRAGNASISHPLRAGIPLSNPYGIPERGLPTMFAAAPVRKADGTTLAVLAFRIDPFRDFVPILQRGRLGLTGETYAFDRRGRLMSESRFDRALRRIGLLMWNERSMLNVAVRDPGVNLLNGRHSPLPAAMQPLTRMAEAAVSGENGQDLSGYRDYRGQRVVGVWRWIPEMEMGIATEQDYDEAFALLETTRRALVWVVLGLAVIVLILAGLSLRANRRIAEGRSHLNAILDNSPALIAVKDLEGRYVQVNGAMLHVMQRSGEDVIGKTDFELFAPAEADTIRQHDKEALRSQEAMEYDERLRLGDETRDYAAIRFPLRDGEEPAYAIGAISTDITERRVSERALRELNEELETRVRERTRDADEANRAKSAFLASMSHEIRNPMNAILGLSQLVLSESLQGRSRDYVRRIHNAAQSLLGLINDVLDFSKIEAGKLELERFEFDLHDEVLDQVSSVVGIKAAEKGLDLNFDYDTDLPMGLVGDPLRLSQVLINLCNNAVKFTEEGDVKVVIRVLPEDDPESLVLRFEVTDTGIGMTRDQVNRIFDAFSQADAATAREHGGTGLGLTISRQLVTLMGGEIGVQSEPGVGSAFWFTARLGRASGLQARPRHLPPELLGLRTLVVDDNASAREILRRQLESLGLDVDDAVSGMAALDLIQTAPGDRPYRLILMDWKMPGMNGIDAGRAIREDGKLDPAPAIIMVSAYGREELFQEAEGLRLDGCLVKPVRESTLLDAILSAFHMGTSPEEATVEQHHPPHDRFPGKRVLVVEDNEDSQHVAREILSRAEIDVTLASGGGEAVHELSQQHFDAVLMDIEMPGMDGYEATQRIREIYGARELPVIAVTANVMAGDRERCLAVGMNDYIAKPIDSGKLYQCLGKWFADTGPDGAPGNRTDSTHAD